jgi:hypothetical protein
VRQALDQGCKLGIAKSGGGHGLALRLSGNRKIALATGHRGGEDPNVVGAFKADLRRAGLIIDGVAQEVDEQGSARLHRRSQPQRRPHRELPEVDEGALIALHTAVSAVEVYYAVQDIGVLDKQSTTARQVRAWLADHDRIEASLEDVALALSELFAHGYLDRRCPTPDNPVYMVPGQPILMPPPLPLREDLDETEAAAAQPGTGTETVSAEQEQLTLGIPVAAWAALERAATAVAEFARLCATAGRPPADKE